jgi:D-glycero-alpha-D-manno-heptose-7-phosphate kinase
MIVTRAPLRISLAGGGTDQPSFYNGRGSSWISAAIDKYCYTMLNDKFTDGYFLKYSSSENCLQIDEIKHDLIRESLKFLPPRNPIEITFTADLPGGTGLGSSGSFLVSLLLALHVHRKEYVSALQLAEEATEIEKNRLKKPIGLQDQYIAAIGGISEFKIDRLGHLTFNNLLLDRNSTQTLAYKLSLFYTGIMRESFNILQDQVNRTINKDKLIIQDLEKVAESFPKIKDALLTANFKKLGYEYDLYWKSKRGRTNGMSNSVIDEAYELAVNEASFGGKLIGAGGGGFLLFVTEQKTLLRQVLHELGIFEVNYRFVEDGATILYRD